MGGGSQTMAEHGDEKSMSSLRDRAPAANSERGLMCSAVHFLLVIEFQIQFCLPPEFVSHHYSANPGVWNILAREPVAKFGRYPNWPETSICLQGQKKLRTRLNDSAVHGSRRTIYH